MKELTYEDWMKNPIPRMMWVWDDYETCRGKLKVIYVSSNKGLAYPVIVLADNDKEICRYKHCAEIEKPKTRRMTHKELSRWLRENPTRECKFSSNNCVFCFLAYKEIDADDEVDGILIRENDGEWREPLVEEVDELYLC